MVIAKDGTIIRFAQAPDRQELYTELARLFKESVFVPSLVVTDLSEDAWAQGFLATEAGITEDQVMFGRVSPPEWKRLAEAQLLMGRMPLYILQRPANEEDVGKAISMARQRMADKGLQLGVVFVEPYEEAA